MFKDPKMDKVNLTIDGVRIETGSTNTAIDSIEELFSSGYHAVFNRHWSSTGFENGNGCRRVSDLYSLGEAIMPPPLK